MSWPWRPRTRRRSRRTRRESPVAFRPPRRMRGGRPKWTRAAPARRSWKVRRQSPAVALSVLPSRASFRWRSVENRGRVLEQLGAAVERAAVDHVERNVRVAVVDAVVTGASGDDGKDDDAEPVHETGPEE